MYLRRWNLFKRTKFGVLWHYKKAKIHWDVSECLLWNTIHIGQLKTIKLVLVAKGIAVRKPIRYCTIHPMSNFISYSNLSSSFSALTSQFSSVKHFKECTRWSRSSKVRGICTWGDEISLKEQNLECYDTTIWQKYTTM